MMADPATAWSKGAIPYRRLMKGAPAALEAQKFFAKDVVKHIKRKAAEGACRVLDIASGYGEPGLSILREAPGVQLTVTDVAPVRKHW